ncbi:MAG TPA: ResA-like WAxxUGC motif-containing protein, partial [Acidimicrobiales bacterium]|nr:ResA-like WAxxUGC motif-containing protein [Acidimicrobiales bacterium]
HAMDARFGVTNIPQAIWIDESGTIVRPPEPASPPAVGEDAVRIAELVGDIDERGRYAERLRDWVARGSESPYALAPDEVLARSTPRSASESEAAAHFELAQHRWRSEGMSEAAIAHFNAAHELQPDNVTYRRQAYSALAVARYGDSDDWNRFRQAPEGGADWPFASDFNRDMARLYPELAARLRQRGIGN